MARTGIGASYVQRQMAAGRSMASIQNEAAANGYQIGPAAAAMFSSGGGGGGGGGAPAPAPAPAQRTGIGATYVQQQMDAGKSLQQIQNEAAQKGYTVGAKAQAMFSNAANRGADYSANRGLPQTGRFFDPTNFSSATNDSMGNGGFGASALARARGSGYTDAQIRSTLAASGVTIGGKAADQLGVMAGKTYYTGPQGKQRPDNTEYSYSGQAGDRRSRPVLLPKDAYNRLIDKPFSSNYLFVAGGESDGETMSNYGSVPSQAEYGSYSEPEWKSFTGENGYNSAFPSVDARGNAIAGTDNTPPELRYKDTFNKAVESGGGTPTQAPVGTVGSAVKAVAEEPTSEAPAPGDADNNAVVEPIKVQAEARNEIKQLDSNVGKLTSGRIRNYYSSRFG